MIITSRKITIVVIVALTHRFSFSAKNMIKNTSTAKKNCYIPAKTDKTFPCTFSLYDILIHPIENNSQELFIAIPILFL